jgi:ceramide glucosyltransferase
VTIDFTSLSSVASLCDACSIIGCAYLAVETITVLYFPKPSCSVASPCEPVSVLKPLHGAEPDLSTRLSAFCTQAYAGDVQIVCGVRDDRDLAAQDVTRLMNVPLDEIELVVDARECGSNRKVSNLVNILRTAQHEILILSDSDIEVPCDYLARVVSELAHKEVGAVTCLYHGVAAAGAWSKQSALAINCHLLPNIVLAVRLGLAQPCFGATIALRRSMLRRIGGFERFADHLADDYAIGAAVRSAGYEVAIPAFSVGHLCNVDSLRALLAQELRAARTIKSINPLGYAGTLITHPFPFALIGFLLGASDAWLIAAAALALRVLLTSAIERVFYLPPQPYFLLPFRDLLSFFVFLLSFCGSRVNWRGLGYRVTAKGDLIADASELPARDSRPV